jgi:hypothetical protein
MALDEYREHAALQLIPNPTAMAAPDSCIACGSSRQKPEPPPQDVAARSTTAWA